ncbi:MAG TPA: DUF4912 domain-containing protein, partial [bacterium]|nr:DUF4912 domain-containing protein [bacterium]
TKKVSSKKAPKEETKKVVKKPTKKATTKKTTKKKITTKKVSTKKVITKKTTKKIKVLVAEPDYRINEELTLTKYDIGAHTAPNVYHKDPMQTEEPPHTYDINKVVILPIDPKFAFIYWEVRQDTIDGVISAFGPGKLTLRVYDVTNIEFNGYNAHEWWDMDVHHRFGTWYLRHNKSDRNLMVDIGIRGNDGNFHAIYRSKAIYFPRDFMVGPGKILWMLVDEFGNKLISDIEDYTDADLELLKKIMGADRFKRFMKGGLDIFLGASAWGRIPIIDTYIDLESMPSSRSGSSAMPTSQGGNKK